MSKKLYVTVSHPGVAPFVQNTVIGYSDAKILNEYITTIGHHKQFKYYHQIKNKLPQFFRQINRREISDAIPYNKVKFYPYKELFRLITDKLTTDIITDIIWEWSEKKFDSYSASILNKGVDWIHVYEHAALETLKRANELNIKSIYEQPSQHHSFLTDILEIQFRNFPELDKGYLKLLNNEKSIVRNARRDQELNIAQHIRCNSSFTKKTLLNAGIEEKKISVIPYGFPETPQNFLRKSASKKVIFLNAGTQNVRKALHLLYIAWRKCNFSSQDAELWLIGKMMLPNDLRQGLPGTVKIIDSIPRNELLNLYNDVDVFILPTLADGFGMVISEAMSRGVPVITTENSGGPDIIEHNRDGFIIPAGDLDALVNQMKYCVRNKHLLDEMGVKAIEKAKKWQWKDFSKAVADFVLDKSHNYV